MGRCLMSINFENPDIPVWLDNLDNELEKLQALSALQTDSQSVPNASEVVRQIPVYQGAMIRRLAKEGEKQSKAIRDLQAEWVQVLLHGAGVIAVRNAIDDLDMLDAVSEVLQQIINDESEGHSAADHFAAAGANSRMWNAHEKLCMASPELFARYNANDTLALVCSAWLGPAYQITTQVNIVHPGGRAQTAHRDYHMGFQGRELLSHYPAHVHALSPLLTLQGGIAHSDVPLNSGPTQLLPFSQKLLSGYMSVVDDAVREHFLQHRVQLSLNKGDMLFFNPALFHAAGDNDTTDQHRFVNLMQIGSAYGRTLEIVDRARMSIELYPVLLSMKSADLLDQRALEQVVSACAEGYAFPASMDLEPPAGGLAPASQQSLMLKALDEELEPAEFSSLITERQALKRSH